MKYQPTASAEFPNDNTELHEGALWVRAGVTGRPRAFIRPETLVLPSMLPAMLPDPIAPIIPAVPIVTEEPEAEGFERDIPEPELEIDIDADELAPEPEPERELVSGREVVPGPEPEPEASAPLVVVSDAFVALVDAAVRVALAQGGSRAAAALPLLLNDAGIADLAGDTALCGRLVASGIATRSMELTDAFAATRSAWRAVLRGEGGDLDACGTATLDDWIADLLLVLLDAPEARRRELKRELRKHGVAAFGMIDVAA